jgi:hypothetical protein
MFVINRCSFTSTTPSINFVVPYGLQQKKEIEQTFERATANITFDELNVSTTHFVPASTSILYTYTTTLDSDGSTTSAADISPGEIGTPLSDNIILNDNLGKRRLVANSNTSFILNATLSTTDTRVSPMISDDGLSLYTVGYSINNMSLANTDFSIVSGGTGYLSGGSGDLIGNVIVSAPDEVGGTRAEIVANVVSGNIVSVYVITEGSGYTTTPTISISASSSTSANIQITGETSSSGGNAKAKYITYPVTLAPGNDSEDLRVFFSAYRPVNTNIYVYYKILAREDIQSFADGNWQLMTIVNGATQFSKNQANLYEFEAAPGSNGVADNFISYTSKTTGYTYDQYYMYAIKIVMASSDTTFVPFLTDMRVLALPSGTGL